MKKKKALIFGGSGFLGSHLSDLLKKKKLKLLFLILKKQNLLTLIVNLSKEIYLTKKNFQKN